MASTKTSLFMRLGNGLMSGLLRSPLHSLMSSSMLLIGVTGRKTGKQYVTPVNYLPDGDALLIVSMRSRTWWRNARSGAVTLRLRGADVPGQTQVIEDEAGVAAQLAACLQRAPKLARYFGVRLDPRGQPATEDIARAARERVVIRVRPGALSDEAYS